MSVDSALPCFFVFCFWLLLVIGGRFQGNLGEHWDQSMVIFNKICADVLKRSSDILLVDPGWIVEKSSGTSVPQKKKARLDGDSYLLDIELPL